jgi:GT2 family glycosyltransferase
VLIEGDGNLWWTAATNLAVTYALGRARPDDFVLTLNDDTAFERDYVERLVQRGLDHPSCLLGSTIVDEADEGNVIDGGVRMNWLTARQWDRAAGRSLGQLQVDEPGVQPVDVLAGRGTLIPVCVFGEVGLYDEVRLPHYAADYEFSRRAARAGHCLLIDHDVVVATAVRDRSADPQGAAATIARVGARLTSRRSPANLRYQLRYARLVCPFYEVPTYMLGFVARMVSASVSRRLRGGAR